MCLSPPVWILSYQVWRHRQPTQEISLFSPQDHTAQESAESKPGFRFWVQGRDSKIAHLLPFGKTPRRANEWPAQLFPIRARKQQSWKADALNSDQALTDSASTTGAKTPHSFPLEDRLARPAWSAGGDGGPGFLLLRPWDLPVRGYRLCLLPSDSTPSSDSFFFFLWQCIKHQSPTKTHSSEQREFASFGPSLIYNQFSLNMWI